MDIKNKVVDAEALYALVFDNTLTSETKLLVIAARLNGGSLPRSLSFKGRGFSEYDMGRALLRQQRKALAPVGQPSVLDLNDDLFPKLTPSPKGKKNARTSAPKISKPATPSQQGTDAGTAPADTEDRG